MCRTVTEFRITSQALEGITEHSKAGVVTDLHLCSFLLILIVMDHVNTSCTAVIIADLIASALIHHLLVLQGQEMTMNLRSYDNSGLITAAVEVTLSHTFKVNDRP